MNPCRRTAAVETTSQTKTSQLTVIGKQHCLTKTCWPGADSMMLSIFVTAASRVHSIDQLCGGRPKVMDARHATSHNTLWCHPTSLAWNRDLRASHFGSQKPSQSTILQVSVPCRAASSLLMANKEHRLPLAESAADWAHWTDAHHLSHFAVNRYKYSLNTKQHVCGRKHSRLRSLDWCASPYIPCIQLMQVYTIKSLRCGNFCACWSLLVSVFADLWCSHSFLLVDCCNTKP